MLQQLVKEPNQLLIDTLNGEFLRRYTRRGDACKDYATKAFRSIRRNTRTWGIGA
jgi:hypothetical protein